MILLLQVKAIEILSIALFHLPFLRQHGPRSFARLSASPTAYTVFQIIRQHWGWYEVKWLFWEGWGGSILGYNDAIRHPSSRFSSINFANLTFQLVEIGYIGLILPNSTSWHTIFAKLKPLENTKTSICYTLDYISLYVMFLTKSGLLNLT